jgi:hypothetical protein
MKEALQPNSSHQRHKDAMSAKAAAKEARLKAALRTNLKRRKEVNVTEEIAGE